MSLLRSHSPRHAKPSKATPVLAAGGLTVALAVADGGAALSTASASSRATASDFAQLRACESGGNYAINTGNGFYGAYQFDRGTWQGLGYSGLPSSASPATQDTAAARLQAARGWQPWPACSRRLGLGSGSGSQSAPRASRSRHVPARHFSHPAVAHSGHAPAFAGHVLSAADVHSRRSDVAAWQARMAARGWDVAVDGHFGPQSAGVAARFTAEKRLRGVHPGTVNAVAWSAAWTLAIS